MIIDGTNGLTFNDSSTQASAGKILQVVQVVKTDTFSTTSSSLVDVTGMSASITPKSSSNKILVMVNLVAGQGTNGNNVSLQLQRDGTAIYLGNASGSRFQGFQGGNMNSDFTLPITPVFLDSPATTSSVTYKIQARTSLALYVNRTGADEDSINRGRTASSITLMEVAA
jgi:hypothetical protein